MSRLVSILGVLAVACGGAAPSAPKTTTPTRAAAVAPPVPGQIKHIVVLTMENRSFDHFLGWLPAADGRQAGLTYFDSAGVAHHTHELAPDFQGCANSDPDHSYQGGRVEYDNGANDGWLRAGANDLYSIGYYSRGELAFLDPAAQTFTTFDRYFPSILSETFPNRIYEHAGQTDRISNTAQLSTLPTIWDRLADAGLQGRYYYSDLPFVGLWGAKYLNISEPISKFFSDAAAGTLPDVSYVDGEFAQEATGTGNDDHPHGDVRNGEAFMNQIYTAVTTSPEWKDTVLIINFDEWGGFFDHVPPPTAAIPPASAAAGDTDGRLGFRVPALLISPWSQRGNVSHVQYDHTSVLRMIEWNWNLPPLTVRDATANNLADELDFAHPKLAVPAFAVPPGPFGIACPSEGPANGVSEEATELSALAQQFGFPIF